MWLNIALYMAAVIGMEGAAWFTHKYVMHGFLWRWHKSHHTPHNHRFELNDLFAVVFSIPAVALIVLGFELENAGFLAAIGLGISTYGLIYFLFHDILVHRRVKFKFKAGSPYLRRIIRAHHIHHSKRTKEGCEAFGFIYAPSKYEKSKTENAPVIAGARQS